MIQGGCAATVTQYRKLVSGCHFQPPPKGTENNSSQPEITGLCKYIEQHLQNQKINLQSLVKKENEKPGSLLFYSLLIKRPPVIPKCFWEYLRICSKRSTWDFSECHGDSF